MTTAVVLTDSLGKDSGGQKFMAWVNIATSQSDFSLPMGIGASTIGTTSRIMSYLGIATAIAGSTLTNNAPAGVLRLYGYTANPSSVAVNNQLFARGDDKGAQYISALSTVTSAMSGSTETFTVASGTLYKILAAGCGVVTGGQIAVLNGGTSITHVVFGGNDGTLPILDLGLHGTCFGSLRFERRNTVGTVYVTANYSNFSQG